MSQLINISNSNINFIHKKPVTAYDKIEWYLSEPEKFDKNKVKNWDSASRFTEQRLKALQEIITVISNFDKEFYSSEQEFLTQQPAVWNSLLQESKRLLLIQVQTSAELQKEIDKLKPDYEKVKDIFDPINKVITDLNDQIMKKRNEIIEVYKERASIVHRIDPKELFKIKVSVEKHDILHNLFKWMINAIYGENISNYYWPNFKQEAYKKDKGQDFMQRLSGVNLSQVKLDSALTKKVLELKQQIMEKVEFSHGRNDSLNAMFEFIDMMNKIVKGYDKIKDLNQEIAKNNKDYLTKKAEFDSVNIFVEGIKWKLFQCKKTSDALNKVNFLIDANLKLIQRRLQVNNLYTKAAQGNTKAGSELSGMMPMVHDQSDTVESPRDFN